MITNTMAKKCLKGGAISLAIFGSSLAFAANQQSYAINLKAEIPSDVFHVIPVDSGWINQTQTMEYDIATAKLQTFEKQFQYKNTTGGIQATLMNINGNGTPALSNGTDSIPLNVEFNGVQLSSSAVTVVDNQAAQAGGRTMLRISQADSAPLTVDGSFTGQVALMFEEVITP